VCFYCAVATGHVTRSVGSAKAATECRELPAGPRVCCQAAYSYCQRRYAIDHCALAPSLKPAIVDISAGISVGISAGISIVTAGSIIVRPIISPLSVIGPPMMPPIIMRVFPVPSAAVPCVGRSGYRGDRRPQSNRACAEHRFHYTSNPSSFERLSDLNRRTTSGFSVA
jgi:hypothetical protein